MGDPITGPNLNEPFNELKEKSQTKDDGWFVKTSYIEDYGLCFLDAALYTILTNLGKKRGYANPFNVTISNILGISERTIREKLSLFKKKNILFIHSYQTQRGIKREMVTIPNSGLYYSYLKKTSTRAQLYKFIEEFLDKLPAPETKPPSPPPFKMKKSAPANSASSESAPAKSAAPAPAKSAAALNTTYLQYRTSDVTCKDPDGSAASSEACSAAFLCSLKKDLEQSFPAGEVAIGMEWYEMQSDSKRAAMKKPIACIIKALKDGYAHEDVSSKNAEIEIQIRQERETKVKKEARNTEINSNKNLAEKLILKFSHLKGWRHKIDSKCFVIYNDDATRCRELGGDTYHLMSNGDKRWGTLGERMEFDMKPSEFRKTLEKYLVQSLWSDEQNNEQKRA